MTKFENDTLITLLTMKIDDLKHNPPKIAKEKTEKLIEEIENISGKLICIDVLDQ